MSETQPKYEIFVKHKKSAAKLPRLDFTDTTEVPWASPNRNTESPISDVGSEVFESSASTSTCTSSTPSAVASTNVVKRKKNKKDHKPEENLAMDPIRYKTKMCKNWQLTEKCPYGPRCLFAHGTKEMRTHMNNHSAIATAASTGSPERQFYAIGHFPSFMPVPFATTTAAEAEASQPEPVIEQAAYTHSPYQIQAAPVPQQPCGAPQNVALPPMQPMMQPYSLPVSNMPADVNSNMYADYSRMYQQQWPNGLDPQMPDARQYWWALMGM